MKYPQMKSIIEGLLFVAGDEGLDTKQLVEVLEVDAKEIKQCMARMTEEFIKDGRGIQIIEIAETYQLTTLPSHAPYFQRLAYSPSRSTLSQAALETLAIVAYKQPITRIDIEEIRGVRSDRAIHTLVAKELIQEVARAEAVGRPILYGTTKSFLDHFGINSIEDMPAGSVFESDDNLAEETRMLFDKLDDRQLTIDDMNES